MKLPRLSKSRFMTGRQCLKRLYLECYRRDLMAPPDAGQRLLFRMGNRLGEMARQCYPSGVLVHETYRDDEAAMAHTRRAMEDKGVPALFEAAFAYDGVIVRVDVLARTDPTGWDLIEVKSGTSVKDPHLWDAAIQHRVLAGCGIAIQRTGVMHLDPGYTHPGGSVDPVRLFVVEDIGQEVAQLSGPVEEALAEMRAVLGDRRTPAVRPGRHCRKPYTCPFEFHCAESTPPYPVWQLPGAGPDLLGRLRDEGIEDIGGIPAGFDGLSLLQSRARDCVLSGDLFLDSMAVDRLRRLEHPLHFLDFESFAPALPLYPGTRPYEQLVFQFSDHILEANGTVQHEEYLHAPGGDPRGPLALALLEALEGHGSIISYSPFERATILTLAAHLPQLGDRLEALAARVVDLLPIVRENVYHADFRGSFSIKDVLRTMIPSLAYDDLDIAEGTVASLCYENLVEGLAEAGEAEATLSALRSYCARDTLAMLELYRHLCAHP